jgi:hypothetical protein
MTGQRSRSHPAPREAASIFATFNFTSHLVHGGSRLCTSANGGWCAVCARQIGTCVEHEDGFCFCRACRWFLFVEHADGFVEHADGFCFTQLHFARHRRLLLQDRSLRHLWKMYFPSTFYIEGKLQFRAKDSTVLPYGTFKMKFYFREPSQQKLLAFRQTELRLPSVLPGT